MKMLYLHKRILLPFKIDFKLFAFLVLILSSGKIHASQVDSVKFKQNLDLFHKHKFTNVDSAGYFLKKMDAISAKNPNSEYRYRYYVTLGGWSLVSREIPTGVESYKKAIILANELKNEEFVIRSKFNLGAAYGEMGEYEKAIAMFKEVEQALDNVKEGNTLFSNQFRANMVQFYCLTNNPATAFKYSDQMKAHLKTYDDSTMYYISRLQLLSFAKRHQESVQLAEEFLSKLRKNDLLFLYQAHSVLGNANSQLSRDNQAFHHLFKARELSIKLGIESDLVHDYLGRLYLKTHDYKNAIREFDQSLSFAEKQKKLGSKVVALSNLKDTYKAMGKPVEALKYMEEYMIMNDSLLGVEKVKSLQNTEARYELKDKEKTIEQQKEVNFLQENLLKEEYQKRITLIGFLTFTVLFAFLIFYFYRKTVRTNQELVLQRNQIEEYATELKNANTMRDKLFAMISHDLRSPVSSLVHSLEQYEYVKPLGNLMNSLNNVHLILNNLLKWAQMQLSARPFRPKEIHFEPLVNSVIKQFQPVIDQKMVQVITDYQYNGSVWADEESLLIILRNIISNAVKFTGENGIIRLISENKEDRISLTVRDSGVGMNAETLQGLFEYPESQSGTMGEKGTGIGMTLTKDLIEKMHGDITVKSRPGIGTSVILHLPAFRA